MSFLCCSEPDIPPTYRPPMKPLLFVIALGICAGVGWTVYSDSLEAVKPQGSEQKEESPPVVETAIVTKGLVEDRIELLGSLEAQSTVEIRAAVPGYVVKLPYELGDFVDAGSVVAELDDSEAQEGVTRSEAALRVAQARLKAQEATASHARSELARWQRLAESGVSTGQQLDTAQAAVAVADSQTDLERAQVEQVKAELEQAKLQLQQCRILAPLTGYVAERLVNRGHLATPDLPLLRLVSIETVRTVVHVPEQDYQKIRVGQVASVTVEAVPEEEFEGTVIRKSPILDPATRTAAVEIGIPNSDSTLKPGMHGKVSVVFDRRSALSIPLSALRETSSGYEAIVAKGNPVTADIVKIETGVITGDRVEVRSGLEERAVVVTRGPQQIADGTRIQPVEVPQSEEKLLADDPEVAGGRLGPG